MTFNRYSATMKDYFGKIDVSCQKPAKKEDFRSPIIAETEVFEKCVLFNESSL